MDYFRFRRLRLQNEGARAAGHPPSRGQYIHPCRSERFNQVRLPKIRLLLKSTPEFPVVCIHIQLLSGLGILHEQQAIRKFDLTGDPTGEWQPPRVVGSEN